ncbi:alpha-N-acetylglucosaminidase [Hymenobacter nivis]|uniref:Alpha-N-acetylglucosaminidase n=1 Tax=Hymenobacter nivis TaxID=1850093 RepID=A0A502GVY2_9BACT|nr:alpha-N-acetylglucosaminidase [Hymenobacter nivis]
MKKTTLLLSLLVGLCLGPRAYGQLNKNAADSLIARTVLAKAANFVVEELPAAEGKDVFEIESKGDKIVLRGNDAGVIGSALYYYLREYAHCQITWNGVNMRLPAVLPRVPAKVHKATPYTYRYYLNYCTYSYSMSWWDWARWEKEIDWMALHGINMPLAITGQEYVWQQVYQDMGFTADDLQGFFSGPAYFGWFYMGNLDGWGGPLPQSWMTSHRELQQKILARERALGMTPVLPAFTGHVPAAFKKRYPNAKLKQTNWTNGFADTYILDSEDPLFAEVGKRFLEAQTKLYGTDHLYSADTFNENEPPSDNPEFLGKLSARIYEGMRRADPQAVWVMQGWLFYSDRKFWKAPQIEALLKAVPDDKMILLDLAAEIEPIWKRTNAFYGKPWIWNMLHNFGGNISMFGRMDGVAQGPPAALHDDAAGKMVGIGLTMEGIEQNPVLYELMTEHTWQTAAPELTNWLSGYVRNRYGHDDANGLAAWQILRTTAYNGQKIRDGAESIMVGRPTLDSVARWTKTTLNYAPKSLLPAWDYLIKAAPACAKSDGFQYDLVDVSRQVLANYALPLQQRLAQAYQQKNAADFKKYSAQFLALMDDEDRLLATRKDFLLGPWVADARKWGTTPSEKALYERNAKDLITLWGDAESPLNEYSNRQWSGLLTDFYKARWQQFFVVLNNSLATGKPADIKLFEQQIKAWEWRWVNTRKDFPTATSGQSIAEAQRVYKKYRTQVAAAYR